MVRLQAFRPVIAPTSRRIAGHVTKRHMASSESHRPCVGLRRLMAAPEFVKYNWEVRLGSDSNGMDRSTDRAGPFESELSAHGRRARDPVSPLVLALRRRRQHVAKC
jgi:hypothetical protein